MYVVLLCGMFCKIDHCIHIHWCTPMELRQNDPWVESHMWIQQKWGRTSSWCHWPLVKVFEKRSLYPHTLMYFHGTLRIQWSLGRVTHVTSTEVRSTVILGSLTFLLSFWKTINHYIHIIWTYLELTVTITRIWLMPLILSLSVSHPILSLKIFPPSQDICLLMTQPLRCILGRFTLN